jgi:hypothetical protein
LSIYAAAAPVGGSNTQLQYNNNGTLGGIPNVTWNGSKLSLGNVANVLMTGGTNGFVLQTDGVGNLSWTAQTGGGGGNGTPGGANTQIQYNDSGSFGGNSGFTFNEVTGNVGMPTDLIVVGNIYGNAQTANFATFSGTATSATIAATANSVAGANVVGTVSSATTATSATTAGTVTTAAQPNITSTGTLTSLTVGGTSTIQQALEKVTLYATANTGTINYNLLDQAIIYNTATSTGNIILNIRGNSSVTANSIINVGNSTIVSYVLKTGATAHSITSITIDGVAPFISWAGATVPTTTTYSDFSYVFNIIKTASTPTYTVFASATRYA